MLTDIGNIHTVACGSWAQLNSELVLSANFNKICELSDIRAAVSCQLESFSSYDVF